MPVTAKKFSKLETNYPLQHLRWTANQNNKKVIQKPNQINNKINE